MTDTIIRIAAKGDGVTADGRHFSGAVTGDVVAADGSVTRGPHRVDPPCSHFAKCGGCQLQHCDEEVLRDFVTSRAVNAAEGQELEVEELLPTHLSPPRSRRRATLHAMKTQKGVLLGYREGRSHKIIDLQECPVLRPELLAMLTPLRTFLSIAASKRPVDIALTLTDQGVDCAVKGVDLDGLEPTEAALDFAREHGLARLCLDQGYGPEPMWEPEPLTVTLANVPVSFPPGAFLQPTDDGEAVLLADARGYLRDANTIADLFSGLGTFAFGLADPAKVLAVEAARDAYLACKTAAGLSRKPVHALHRDLFRAPLQADELGRFGALLLDPPRAGAREQISCIAESNVERVAYISCNPSSWARDVKVLSDAGFKLKKLRPVGQFRWSTHVELTSYLER
ncbi:class I SAM-dependent RNA methyltransferase [Erythrobacter sp. W53]|uniref:class I SAM-dependent RNA methyltransferase n=1 Tax=Erythrobacter sp. W53 TaxID=3425947 RepID=UPI003D766A53